MENPIYGMHRAKVVDNKDPEKFGRVKVWIPDIMPEVEDTKGLWARPANNPFGGRNMENSSDHHFAGSSIIPLKGSWVWIFFESGNINMPYYFGALDLENTKVLPENQSGSNYEKKWTILKSHEGRTIHISDDSDDARVEICGKKRLINTPPTGDTDSVFQIDDNMTTILLDEREGKEKILIRTYKGDYIHIDVDEQNLQMYFKNDINIKCDGKLSLHSTDEMHIKTDSDMFVEAGGIMHRKSGGDMNDQCGGTRNLKAGGEINTDGSTRNDQSGKSGPATSSDPTDPTGERDT